MDNRVLQYQAAVRKLQATYLRQKAALDATEGQIAMFEELIAKASQVQLDLVKAGATPTRSK